LLSCPPLLLITLTLSSLGLQGGAFITLCLHGFTHKDCAFFSDFTCLPHAQEQTLNNFVQNFAGRGWKKLNWNYNSLSPRVKICLLFVSVFYFRLDFSHFLLLWQNTWGWVIYKEWEFIWSPVVETGKFKNLVPSLGTAEGITQGKG
jgi:hypothetical protein